MCSTQTQRSRLLILSLIGKTEDCGSKHASSTRLRAHKVRPLVFELIEMGSRTKDPVNALQIAETLSGYCKYPGKHDRRDHFADPLSRESSSLRLEVERLLLERNWLILINFVEL